MALLEDEVSLDITLGQVLRLPCKFIKGKSTTDPVLVETIARQLKNTKKNLLPIIVKALGEDNYQAIFNIQILEAARKADLDFVWCMVVDDKMNAQIQIESGQLVQVNILTASEEDILGVLEFVQVHRPGFKNIKAKQAAKAIVEYRKTKKISSLSFLTKQKCGIGQPKLAVLSEFLITK